ncbi:MAG TPA: heat-inducible transcription repressor HrcA [Candidatus Avacidaminococcus intestinavium]|uniref:Heat-inducible transcription repressor HrcA n=1 Tax=Candidatus Avacidaminococcus intestinavium TaxID=2840684 RepID=A0A9D1MNB8_9FIRM|nr:heat-inducible transcription repressor HrcA [Candidatus Avacidaminococcus intestinavium]
MLNERKKRILQIIIEDYISTAEPVGSRTIARQYDLGLSPATIRNEMSDLEVMGFLEQPHTSAGRIPSAQAYRFYVDSMIEPGSLTENDQALIDAWYHERLRNIDEIFQSTAKILSRMTKNVSLVLADNRSSSIFRYLKFLPLDGTRAILCVITDDGVVDNCVVEVPLGMTTEEMDYLAKRISNKLQGYEIIDISQFVLQDVFNNLAEDKILYASIIQALQNIGSTSKEQKVFLGGTKQLLNQPEFRSVERIKDLLTILEEEKVLKDILHVGEDSGIKITIGNENKFTGIQDCSMVQATYRLNGRVVGTMAVLGPTRMEYGKIISVMDYLHHYLKILFDENKQS